MTFHDIRGEYDRIAKWLEESETEIPWEEVMKSEWWVGPPDWVPPPKWSMPTPFPRPISAQTVTKLILAQVNQGLRIPWPPAEGENEGPGGEGVEPGPAAGTETGPTPWEKFLQTLEALEVRTLTLKLITPEERKQLVRMAWIEEELQRREVERNRERVRRQLRGETKKVITRRGVKGLVRAAMLGNREAIKELERRGIVSEEEMRRWRGVADRKGERMKKLNREKNPKKKSVFWPGDEMKKTKEKAELEAKLESKPEPENSTSGTMDDRRRELVVTRVGPNPRILTCSYESGGIEFQTLVKVKEVKNFRRGMKFWMEEPEGGGIEGPWEYTGKLPRLLGRW
jgi:hypothetical protein